MARMQVRPYVRGGNRWLVPSLLPKRGQKTSTPSDMHQAYAMSLKAHKD